MKPPKMNDLKKDVKGTHSLRSKMAQSTKVKITINFDADILEEIKKMANDQGSPYQTLLNKIVRDSIKRKKSEESRLDRLEKELKALQKKVS